MNIAAFAFDTPYLGYRNQLLGALKALRGNDSNAERYLLPLSDSDGEAVCFSNCKNYKDFSCRIFAALDKAFLLLPEIPRVFLAAFNFTETGSAQKNSDMLCRAVKEYYTEHNLGNIFTAILSSRLYDYEYADLINVPRHLLDEDVRRELLKNKKLRRKTVITIGIIHSFSREKVADKKVEFLNTIQKDFQQAAVSRQIKKLRDFVKTAKKAVICLGGRTEKNEIVFTRKYADDLWQKCCLLTAHGYGVVIVNGPRTPNFIADYLYKKSLTAEIVFHNCKTVAATTEEKNKWRLYSGQYENEFRLLSQIGNIYPAVLGFSNTIAVHTLDSFSCCETISAGIPTAISTEEIFISFAREDCFRMLDILTPKYALKFEDFVDMACYMKIEPQNLRSSALPDVTKVFANAVYKRLK